MKIPIVSKVDPFASVLRRGRFYIPRYQRPFAWKSEHVQSLMEDLVYCVETNQPHYFLGTIMLIPHKNNNENWEINDGQQRITTFLLICANLCRYFNSCGDTGGENQTLRVLFNIPEGHNKKFDEANKLEPRLLLSTNDKTNFESIINGVDVGRNGEMTSAWSTIKKFLSQPKYASLETQKKILDFILNKLLVVRIEFQDAVDSIAVFETLNARGKALEQIQITCAYFYSCLREDEVRSNRIHEHIDKIRTNFNNSESRFFDYVRCSTQCRYGHLTKERFCHDIKNATSKLPIVRRANEICDMVDGLSQDYKIGIFQILERRYTGEDVLNQLTKDARKSNSRRKIRDYLEDLHEYRSVSNSIMFSLMCKYSANKDTSKKTEVAKFVYNASKLLASFFQRASHSFSRSFSPSPYEQGVSDLAQKITDNKCTTSNDFLGALHKLDKNNDIISDSQYKDRMRSIRFSSKTTKAKYILARVNEQLDKELVVDLTKSTIEHILPESVRHSERWEFTNDERENYAYRLGNLTLLSQSDNKPSKEFNSTFKVKKNVFKDSSYQITQKLCDYETWDKNAIEKRQSELAKFSAEIWNFNID